MTFSGSLLASGKVPPSGQMPCSRAIDAIASWMAPCPSGSALPTLSLSLMPMMGQYSGNSTSLAPVAAASATRRRAVARFSSTTGVETICTAATIDIGSPLLAAGTFRSLGIELRDDGRLPRSRHLHLVGQRLQHGRRQEQLGQVA